MIPLPKVMIVDRETASNILIAEQYERSDLRCVLSINDAEDPPPVGFHEFSGHKIALHFDDVIDTQFNYVPPVVTDVLKIIAWAKAVNGPCLVHCAAGKSRSTASAVAIPAVRMTPSESAALAIMNWLVQIRPVARPNPLIVQILDESLGWQGALCEAQKARFSRYAEQRWAAARKV